MRPAQNFNRRLAPKLNERKRKFRHYPVCKRSTYALPAVSPNYPLKLPERTHETEASWNGELDNEQITYLRFHEVKGQPKYTVCSRLSLGLRADASTCLIMNPGIRSLLTATYSWSDHFLS